MAAPLRRPAFVGLPSTPAPRSRSLTAGIPKHEIPPRPGSAAGHRHPSPSHSDSPPPSFPKSLRTQRSLVNLPTTNSFNDAPPVPPVPLKERRRIARIPPPPLPVDIPPTVHHGSSSRKESISSLSSATSNTSGSSASSLFSSKALSSAASSTTSLEDEEVTKTQPKVSPGVVAEGFGSSLWNRLANAAGNLSISVSKAWESNVATYMGEITPPGQESRLTRALKEYHIAKARTPSDLPVWLFEERERRVTGRLRVMNPSPDDNPMTPTSFPTPPMPVPAVRQSAKSTPSRANSTRSSSQSDTSLNNSSTPTSQPMTRVAERLQRMREGVTSGRVRFVEQVHPRKMASTPNLREARVLAAKEGVPEMPAARSPSPPPVGAIGLGDKVTSNQFPAAQYPAVSRLRGPGLARVDIKGRGPSANGLPTGVRPMRAVVS